ncbi:MAG: hypothetical protein U9N46_13460 [Euryarchaeota archaeon]|nr:hypothetical protein [Euryarchaeota archaeon]
MSDWSYGILLVGAIKHVPDLLAGSRGADIDSEYIKGAGKLDGGGLLILPDLEKVVAAA